jgi:hypothetical protein
MEIDDDLFEQLRICTLNVTAQARVTGEGLTSNQKPTLSPVALQRLVSQSAG